jgi:hypothetical protein
MIDEMLNVAMLAAKWAGLPFEDFRTDMQDTEKGRRLSRLSNSAWHRRCRRLWTCPFGARADE